MKKNSNILVFRKGQSLVEYGLLLALLVIGVILILQVFGISVKDLYCQAAISLGGGEACATAAAVETAYCVDDFAGGMENWKNLYNASAIQNGQLCMQQYSMTFNQCSMKESERDYTVDLSNVVLEQGDGYGVFFRMTNANTSPDGYIFQYDPRYNGGTFIFRKWVNGRETAPFAITSARGYDWYNTPHDVSVDVNGDTFTAYIDGEPVLSAVDSTYKEGGAGLRTWDSTKVCFDGFSMDTLP